VNPLPNDVFVVPAEVFAQLDPIERIVIKDQERRGLVRIVQAQNDLYVPAKSEAV
jgi:hypothetical protein